MTGAVVMIHGRGPKPGGDALLNCWKQFLPEDARAKLPLAMVLWVDLFKYTPTYQAGPVDCQDIPSNDLPETTAEALRQAIPDHTSDQVQHEITAQALSFPDLTPIRDAVVQSIWTDFIAVTNDQFAIDVRNFFRDDPDLRNVSRQRLLDAIQQARKAGHEVLVLAHSFGTVVAYEAARALADREIHTLVTMGSPLAWCYDMWSGAAPPARPSYTQTEEFPRFGVRNWWNVYDPADVVSTGKVLAAAPQIAPKYQYNDQLPVIVDAPIRNTYAKPDDWGSPHDYRGYLESQPVRRAIRLFMLETQS